jgi:hypothetical protein
MGRVEKRVLQELHLLIKDLKGKRKGKNKNLLILLLKHQPGIEGPPPSA